MLHVTSFYCRSLDLDHLDLFWELSNFDGNIRQYDFYLYRSESAFGPWTVIAGPFQDQYYFRDTTAPSKHEWRNLYYLLKVVDKVTHEEASFGPTAQEGESDLIAMEINRLEDVLFREFVGRKCWLFPVRSFGAYCVCVDRVSGRRTKSNCLNCYDAGFLGGYLSPIQCFVQIDASGNASQATPYGELQPNQTSARLISFPQVKPKDILIEAENKRWRVEKVTTTERLRSVVHQELLLSKITKGDVEYKLPVNVADLRELEISSERNFTLRQHVDGEKDYTDIMAAYGFAPRGTVR
jgi:hypothetical protein